MNRRDSVRALAGPFFFGAIAFLILGGAYAMWPAAFITTPFADMPSAMLLRTVASFVLSIVGLEFLGAFAIVMRAD